MIAASEIQTATLDDLDAIGRMRAAQGWRRSDPVVRAVLTSRVSRVFVIRASTIGQIEGVSETEPIATTSALAAGPVGIIGNVVVHSSVQRRGLGRLLTSHAIHWLLAQGARNIWLDATPDGRPLYRKLGFTEIAPSWFAYTPLRDLRIDRLITRADSYTATLATSAALPSLAALDHEAFGGDRMDILHAILRQPECALFVATANDSTDQRPLGYAITRRIEEPENGFRLGSLVAPSDAVAAALTLAAINREIRNAPVEVASGISHITLSGGAMPRARRFFDSIGVATVDDDIVMRLTLDTVSAATDTETLSAAQEREEGRPSLYSWIAPMLF